jgi:phosphoserine phosphatase RsbU/P
LETANRLLGRRTEVLTSLYDIGLALTTSVDLADLADRICRHAHDLAGARRAILYYLPPGRTAVILAQRGWEASIVGEEVPARLLWDGARPSKKSEPAPFTGSPPGVPAALVNKAQAVLTTGLRVPLLAQNEIVGFMMVHAGRPSSQKSAFTPGETTLLQTFASQAALAIQRTGLIQSLREKVEELEAAQAELIRKERLDRELELARQMQQSLLPQKFPHFPGFAFAARSQPARVVGGDFYDIFRLDDHHFGLVIADVSDKGMPAALFMALTRSLILAEARREFSPRAVLLNVNRLLLELSEPKMFVTVFYGVVDARTGRLTYARAGHDWPFLLRPYTAPQRLEGAGTFVGFLDEDLFYVTEQSTILQPGDRLVLYSDGCSDALNPAGESLGPARWLALLADKAAEPAAAMCRSLFTELALFQHTAEQYDDITLLVVEVQRG